MIDPFQDTRFGGAGLRARAISFCTTNLGWTREEVSPADGLHQWAVLRTPAAPPERRFDHFVEF